MVRCQYIGRDSLLTISQVRQTADVNSSTATMPNVHRYSLLENAHPARYVEDGPSPDGSLPT